MEKPTAPRRQPKKPIEPLGEHPVRSRILDAAFAAFTEVGYAHTSTLEIATRAGISKRDLYALVGNKQQILASCIERRARRLRVPAELPKPQDRETLAKVLIHLGTQLLQETTHPTVVAVFRLAIAEAVHAPEVARALDAIGRQAVRAALIQIMTHARSSGLLRGRVGEMTEQFAGLLWRDLLVSLLLGVVEPPSKREVARRARVATTSLLELHAC
jgi:AcrR family transcriptional regulator